MSHTCHAVGCTTQIAKKFFMCPHHWSMVDKDTQRSLYAEYKQGLRDNNHPTLAWYEDAHEAMQQVLQIECSADHREPTESEKYRAGICKRIAQRRQAGSSP